MRDYIKQYRALLILGLSVVVVYAIAEFFTGSYIAHAQANITPFTLRLENRAFLNSEGKPVTVNGGELIDTKTKARRSDGARLDTSYSFGKTGFFGGSVARVITLPTGEAMTVYDAVRGVTRWNAHSETERNRKKALLFSSLVPPGCMRQGEQATGIKETIMGQETVVVIGRPNVTKLTEWRAINLNCEAIQARIEVKQPDGSYKLHNEIYPVSLKLGEPDPSLFDVPKDYAELKPSEFLHKEADRLHIQWNDKMEKEAQLQDGQYLSMK